MDNCYIVTLILACLLVPGTWAQMTFTKPASGNAAATNNVPEDTTTTPVTAETVTVTGETGTVIFTVVSQDGDTTAANILFEFTTADLKTKTTATFDYETKSSYVLIIQAVDGSSPMKTASGTVTVSIGDVNEEPTWPAYVQIGCISSSSVEGDVVGTFTATDPDTTSPNNEIASYAIAAGDDSSQFTVTTSGMIKRTGVALDITVKNWYELQYTATDSGTSPKIGTSTVYIALDSPFCASGAISLRGSFLGLAVIFLSLLSVHV